MFERFTDRARRVVVLAQEEARLLDHGHIGTEHLLLGLVAEDGVAAGVLADIGLTSRPRVATSRRSWGAETRVPSGHIPFTPRAKKALESSLREALDMGHDHIGTEHILLGIVRDHEGAAAAVLGKHASREAVRAHVRSRLEPGGAPATATATATADPAAPPLCGRCGAGLTDALTTTEVQVPEHAGEGRLAVAFARCVRCGAVVGCSPEDPDVFERFTDRARRVVVLAQEEARLHNHNYIGTEHILLGLLHEAEGSPPRHWNRWA